MDLLVESYELVVLGNYKKFIFRITTVHVGRIFNIIITLGAGLIIAFVTTFYLKKKDEITRVAGVILEKRVNSEQEILEFLEDLAFHKELHNGK